MYRYIESKAGSALNAIMMTSSHKHNTQIIIKLEYCLRFPLLYINPSHFTSSSYCSLIQNLISILHKP